MDLNQSSFTIPFLYSHCVSAETKKANPGRQKTLPFSLINLKLDKSFCTCSHFISSSIPSPLVLRLEDPLAANTGYDFADFSYAYQHNHKATKLYIVRERFVSSQIWSKKKKLCLLMSFILEEYHVSTWNDI